MKMILIREDGLKKTQKKENHNGFLFIYYRLKQNNYALRLAFFSSLISLRCSINAPPIQ